MSYCLSARKGKPNRTVTPGGVHLRCTKAPAAPRKHSNPAATLRSHPRPPSRELTPTDTRLRAAEAQLEAWCSAFPRKARSGGPCRASERSRWSPPTFSVSARPAFGSGGGIGGRTARGQPKVTCTAVTEVHVSLPQLIPEREVVEVCH